MQENPQLYWNIVSPPSRAVKAFLDIAKIPYKLNTIDLFKMEQRKPAFLNLNPMGTVPTLVHGNLKVYQSIAILAYLCQAFPFVPKSYYGTTIEERAVINQFLSWSQSYLRPSLGGLFFIQKQIGLRKRKVLPSKDVAQAQAKILQGLATLDSVIGEKQYIANGTFTIADIAIYSQVTILVYYGKDHYSYKNIDRWFKNIYAIPQVKTLTHQWFPVAQQMQKIVSQLPVQKATL